MNNKLPLMLAIIFILVSQAVFSIGLKTGPLPDYIVAQPLKQQTFEFVADGFGNDIRPYFIADPDLEGYIKLSEPEVVGPSQKKFKVAISFPEVITAEPGFREVLVGAEELIAEGGGVVPKTKVQYRLKIFILYQEKYIDADFTTQNVNVNEIADFSVNVRNFGVPDIKVLMATVEVYNASGSMEREIESGFYSVLSGEEETIHLQLNTTGMLAGERNATAIIYYDGDEMSINKSFRIGHMKVKVTDYTKQLYTGKINKFNIGLENEWNGMISSIYADIAVETPSKNLSTRTAAGSIKPLSEGTLEGYIDTEDVLPGEYPVKIELYYENDKSVERGVVNIVKPSLLEAAGNPWFVVGVLVLLIIIVLTIINVWLLMKRKR